MRALVRHLRRVAPDATLLGLRRFSKDIECAIIEIDTGAPQRPAFAVMPRERLLITFHDDGRPVVGPLREDFPSTPHSDFVADDEGLPISRTLCLDDRPWEDAKSDYNSAELLRRILAWFARAASGQMDDPLQFPEPAFRPAPISVVMPPDASQWLMPTEATQLRYLAVTGDDGVTVLRGVWSHQAGPAGEGAEWIRHLILPLGSKTDQRGGWGWLPATMGQMERGWGGGGSLYSHLRERLGTLHKNVNADGHAEFFGSRPLLLWLNVDATRGEQIFGLVAIDETTGTLMEKLGLAWPSDGAGRTYLLRVPAGEPDQARLGQSSLAPINFFQPFEIGNARALADRTSLAKKAIVVGAGAIGSQVVELLTREGAWDEIVIIDDDFLLPHNLARHTLTEDAIAKRKADQVAARLAAIIPTLKVRGLAQRLYSPLSSELENELNEADLILDFTASLGASRLISDCQVGGRRACAFFNPNGDGAAILVESQTKHNDINILEARYYSALLQTPEIFDHLKTPTGRMFVSGGCRDLTNLIPASRAALLSAAVAEALTEILSIPKAEVRVLSVRSQGITMYKYPVDGTVQTAEVNGWVVRLPFYVQDRMRAMRRACLPNETGGVILGIIDHARKRIEVADFLPPPLDSQQAAEAFERGVRDLDVQMREVGERTAFQLLHVGEWHSHPGDCAVPSSVDRATFERLVRDSEPEDRPVVMVIVGERELQLILELAP
jgi:integrative and conjugative element protein (TIGR02256 family)